MSEHISVKVEDLQNIEKALHKAIEAMQGVYEDELLDNGPNTNVTDFLRTTDDLQKMRSRVNALLNLPKINITKK